MAGPAELAAQLGAVHRVPEREHRLALRLGLCHVHRLDRVEQLRRGGAQLRRRHEDPAQAPPPLRRPVVSSRYFTLASSTIRATSLPTRRRRGITRSGMATLTRLRIGRPAAKSNTIHAASTPN